jgi:hypothetical protein
MEKMSNLLIGLILMLGAQTITWYATNGQFIWPTFKDHPLLVSIILGTISCYMFVMSTKYCSIYFDKQVWPIRLLSFSMGIGSFSFLTWYYMNQGFNLKSVISLLLTVCIVCIQVFWK